MNLNCLLDKAFAPSLSVEEIFTASYGEDGDNSSSEHTVLDQRPFTVSNAVALTLSNGE